MGLLPFAKSQPLGGNVEDVIFEDIFLHNAYPDGRRVKRGAKKTTSVDVADKAELWALYDRPLVYNGLNMLRKLRTLWGIHAALRIGARSVNNSSPRGIFQNFAGKKSLHDIYFECYTGNISDATRKPITMAPYSHQQKSRALSQKLFMRIVIPLRALSPLEKIDALLMGYSIANFIDPTNFAGIVDPDIFLFLPPDAVRAGIAHYQRKDQLLNTHLVAGFNFYEHDASTIYFTHGQNRYGAPDLILRAGAKMRRLATDDYGAVLRYSHQLFLQELLNKTGKFKASAKLKPSGIPEQISGMMGKIVTVVNPPI